jgi:prepilin signal peptidase PulO-like enzyme (type II secretory pathway)
MMIFVLGLCAGSFVNMLEYRTANKYKLIKIKFKKLNKNRSVCDFCGNQLNWYDNIPVMSWLWLGGKSRCCAKKLPIAYPIIELSAGLMFLIDYQLRIVNYGWDWNLGLDLAVITLLAFLAVFDMKYMILPDFSEYILIGIAAVSLIFKADRWQYAVTGVTAYLFDGRR